MTDVEMRGEEVSMEDEEDEEMEEEGDEKELTDERWPFLGGAWNSRTFNGHPVDQVKSALQKAARMGETDRMMAAAFELDLFRMCGEECKDKWARFVTMLQRRVQIITVEETCFSEVAALCVVGDCMARWGTPTAIVEACRAISGATKDRTPSHMRAVAKHLSPGEPSAEAVAEVKKLAEKQDSEVARRFVAQVLTHLDAAAAAGAAVDDGPELDRAFAACLQLQDARQPKKPKAAAKPSTDAGDGKDEKKRKAPVTTQSLRGKIRQLVPGAKKAYAADGLLWAALWQRFRAGLDTKTQWPQAERALTALYKWQATRPPGHKERYIFAFRAMFMYRHRGEIDWSAESVTALAKSVKCAKEEAAEIRARNLALPPPTIVVERDVDMHTKAGRAKGKDAKTFSDEGAQVANANKTFGPRFARHEQAYVADKHALAEAKKAKKGKGKRRAETKSGVAVAAAPPPTKRAKQETATMTVTEAKEAVATWLRTGLLGSEAAELSAERVAAILDLPHAQRTTSGWKQLVAMDADCVWKGPYFLRRGECTMRLECMLRRRLALLAMGFYQPDVEAHVHDHGTVRGGAAVWLRMSALHTVPPAQWQTTPGKGGTGSFQPDDIRLVDRASTGVVRASDLGAADYKAAPQLARDVTLALVARYVMDPPAGDSGLWNLLVRRSDGRVASIDLEEVRHLAAHDVKMADAPFAPATAAPAAAKTARDHALALGLLVTSSRGFGKDRAEAFATAIGTDTFTNMWQAFVAAARKQAHVPISESRIAEVERAVRAVANAMTDVVDD